MEPWRKKFDDAPSPEVEITFWLARRFFATDENSQYGGEFTDIDLPFVVDAEKMVGYLPSKDAAKHKKAFLAYYSRVNELEKTINNNLSGRGKNLWYEISIKNHEKSIWGQATSCPPVIDQECFPHLSKMADMTRTGMLHRSEHNTKDDDTINLIFATPDHVHIVEYDMDNPDDPYKSIRLNRPAFSKSFHEAVFRAGTLMEYATKASRA